MRKAAYMKLQMDAAILFICIDHEVENYLHLFIKIVITSRQ